MTSTPSREFTSAIPSLYDIQNRAVESASARPLSLVNTDTEENYSAGIRVSGSIMWWYFTPPTV